jgi:hypothetical protein
MSDYSGFLIRNNLNDNGSIPRSGSWTGCPDILVGGQKTLDTKTILANYDKSYNEVITENFNNNLYVRSKNTTNAMLEKKVYLFQVPQHLFLTPNIWYNQNNLLIYNKVIKDPNDPNQTITIPQNYQTISADSGQIVSTNAFNFRPTTTEHHCMVVVVADNFDAVQSQFPKNINNRINDYAAWIYANGNIGWHNVSIQATTASDVYESQAGFLQPFADAEFTCSIQVSNAPVGAEVGFTSNTNTKWGDSIAVDRTPVRSKPGAKDPNINPSLIVGTNVKIQEGYASDVSYYIDLKGKPMPDNFAMNFIATVAADPTKLALQSSNMKQLMQKDSLHSSFLRNNFDEHSVFVDAKTGNRHTGLEGFMKLQSLSVIPTFVATIGSYGIRPKSGYHR